jgi:hypothetical protein
MTGPATRGKAAHAVLSSGARGRRELAPAVRGAVTGEAKPRTDKMKKTKPYEAPEERTAAVASRSTIPPPPSSKKR